ncbi:MAG TPA: cobalamin biosynthesis protein [Solirubrobacterales bacterium]|nr:cobalamin biosynthesis protein [Solirubrobacterales bacterium]
MSAVGLGGGFAADALLGDPPRLHPVAGFGRVASAAERLGYAPSRARGALYAATLVLGAALFAELATRACERTRLGRGGALALSTWTALGGRSLARAARRLGRSLDAGDLDRARQALPALCGRDASELDCADLSRAAVESVAENTADAVVGALFWAALAGPAGVVAYRAANTLDAMVGYRDERYASFGWAAARLDDVLSWPGARLTAALAIALAPLVGGSPRPALRVALRDGPEHPSPNAGLVEAAFAGALGLRLGGPLAYGGRAEVRATLGDGRAPAAADIERAIRLSTAVGVASAALATCARAVVVRRRRP